eukprot:2906833-Alexandrium_andersonii.AAC.1
MDVLGVWSPSLELQWWVLPQPMVQVLEVELVGLEGESQVGGPEGGGGRQPWRAAHSSRDPHEVAAQQCQAQGGRGHRAYAGRRHGVSRCRGGRSQGAPQEAHAGQGSAEG